MMTLSEALTRLDLWYAAEAKLADGQSIMMDTGNGRYQITRADLPEVRRQIEFWEARVQQLTAQANGANPTSNRFKLADFS